ncbi:MAG: hypothetical protein ACXW5U_28225 [Thermoanaerobaculia bacterium]
MGVRGKRQSRKQSPRKEEAPELSVAASEEETSAAQTPASVLPPLSAIVNALLVGVVIAAAGIGAHLFWPSLTTNVVLGAVGSVVVGGYLFFKAQYDKELKAFFRLVMPRRSTTGIVLVLLAAELTTGVVTLVRRRQPVVRIVAGPRLRMELGFPGQQLVLTAGNATFPVNDPKPTLFYIGGGTDHIREAIEAERKANPRVLDDLLWSCYGIDTKSGEDENLATTIRDEWQKNALLVKHGFMSSNERTPSATFMDPITTTAPVTLLLKRVRLVDEGLETYEAELPQ